MVTTEKTTENDRLKLMVVDDELDNLDLLYRTFRREFDVFQAESGMSALQILEQQGEMAIIISDQRMSGMNGTDFLSRTVDRFPDTIRILLTGYTDAADLVDAINAGQVFKYITKPWNPKHLKMIVMQAAETYRVVKQRTNELHRALRRESIFNAVTTAIRESLDYHSMLATLVQSIGQTFTSDVCLLRSVEFGLQSGSSDGQLSAETFIHISPSEGSESAHLQTAIEQAQQTRSIGLAYQTQLLPANSQIPYHQLIVPLSYQQEPLAVLTLQTYGSPVAPWTEEEIGLIEEVAEQAALALSQAKLYQRIQKQTEQMRGELAVARQIQMNLLRQNFPELDRFKIQAYCFPAHEIGGDFFEIYVHPQGDIWLAVGDVSGKGVPAALFMASALSLLRRELAQEVSPAPDSVMRNLNHSLFDNLVSSNCFITMALARFRPATGELVYANAGHIYPIVWSCPQLAAEVQAHQISLQPQSLQVRGVPLGILPSWQALAGQLTLMPGDVLLLTSDGITEATLLQPSETSSMLQSSGLWQLIIQELSSQSPLATPPRLDLKSLLLAIQTHTQMQEDDQTMLSLEVL
ncbi:MAG: SpoIIE family protein phosphatase [Elainella sp. Prado103]|jgi:serine phosphatase RsbU (regulator of sigma subunit)/CheY-like chemotaxis protein|nr:SpoIIE family protein phosphatase [Elainella sp. Prado103]